MAAQAGTTGQLGAGARWSIMVVSLIVVPLRVQTSIFGAVTLAWSSSPRRYGASDLALIEELARRAAVAIDNANLYAASQNERSRVEAATRAAKVDALSS